MAKFEIYNDKSGEFRFRLKADNGQNILASEGYTTKTNCLNGIESVRENSQGDFNFQHLESKNGNHYFNLKASNGQVIGTSQMYTSNSGVETGIDSVKKNAPSAELLNK